MTGDSPVTGLYTNRIELISFDLIQYMANILHLFFFSLTHWKQNLFLLDNPVQVSKGDRVEGQIKIYRHPEWRRHLRVLLQFKVFSGFQMDIEVIIKGAAPRHENTCLWGFQPGPRQTGLNSQT